MLESIAQVSSNTQSVKVDKKKVSLTPVHVPNVRPRQATSFTESIQRGCFWTFKQKILALAISGSDLKRWLSIVMCKRLLYDIELPYRHGNLFATKLPSYTLLLDTFWANFITINLISV